MGIIRDFGQRFRVFREITISMLKGYAPVFAFLLLLDVVILLFGAQRFGSSVNFAFEMKSLAAVCFVIFLIPAGLIFFAGVWCAILYRKKSPD